MFKSSDSVVSFPEFNVILENRINKKSREAKIHVLLSKKSVVFLTPPICCESPPNVEANPPPLDFGPLLPIQVKMREILLKKVLCCTLSVFYLFFNNLNLVCK